MRDFSYEKSDAYYKVVTKAEPHRTRTVSLRTYDRLTADQVRRMEKRLVFDDLDEDEVVRVLLQASKLAKFTDSRGQSLGQGVLCRNAIILAAHPFCMKT